MVRNCLSYPLLVVLLAGPWLCCCATPRVIARMIAGTSATGRHSCCQPPKPADPPRDKAPCPCQDASPSVALAAADPSADPVHVAVQTFFAAPEGADVPPAVAAGRPSEAEPSPFLTSNDLLFSHHRLRC